MNPGPTKRDLSRRIAAFERATDHNDLAYYGWFTRVLRGEVDHGRESPPEGVDAWFDTPAGQAAIDRSVAALREARARVDPSEETET